jgi:hypothetical protein
VIQSSSDLGSSTWNLGLKLLIRVSHSPIYIPGEFRSIWRSPSSGSSYLGFQATKRAQLHLRIQCLEGFALAFQLDSSGGGYCHLDLSFGRVWTHLESSYSWAELLRVSTIY